MTREEAIARIELAATEMTGTLAATTEPSAEEVLQRYIYAYDMAISALRKQPRWISVEERLPEDERKVLVYYGFDNDGDGDLGMMFIGTLSYFRFDPDPHWQHASLNLVVTHWMPLPEPPEVEV